MAYTKLYIHAIKEVYAHVVSSTTGGCHKNGDKVTAPTLMWVKVMTILMSFKSKNMIQIEYILFG